MAIIGRRGQAYRDRSTTSQRFEAKYLISELQALAIRDYIDPYVSADAFAKVYPVTSLYLDSPDLIMHWSSELGEKNRYKLRIRSYGDSPDTPVFFEVKRRMDQVVQKRRATVRRSAVAHVLAGRDSGVSAMYKPCDAKGYGELMYFRDLMETLSATPRVTVRYEREAYVSCLEEPVRITFDRNLCCLHSQFYDDSIWSASSHWRYQDFWPVILEVKFTDQFPVWVHRLVQRFGLMRTSFAKYCECVRSLHRMGIAVAGA